MAKVEQHELDIEQKECMEVIVGYSCFMVLIIIALPLLPFYGIYCLINFIKERRKRG